MVSYLLLQKYNLDATDEYGLTSLALAVLKGHHPTVKLLIEKGASFNTMKKSSAPMTRPAEEAHEDVVWLRIRQFAPYWSDFDSRTPLWLAIFTKNKKIVKLLVEKGANLSFGDKRGQTPLSWAARMGDLAIAKLLSEKGAGVDKVDKRS